MQGYNVLFPMGFDAFGLPAENAAIKQQHPSAQIYTYDNIERMRRQLRPMGTMFDWSREVVTCDPEYYRWNQWFFLQFFKRGLAYRKLAPVDWCPHCNTTLAREQVVGKDRLCERCDTPVIKRDLNQWFFNTTALRRASCSTSTASTGRSGSIAAAAELDRQERGRRVRVADRRPADGELPGLHHAARHDLRRDLLVLAPEHPLVEQITTDAQRRGGRLRRAGEAADGDRARERRAKRRRACSPAPTAINPFNGEHVPIYIADYVLMSYGTGAIMAVPAHDERDFDFATQYGLPITVVIAPPDGTASR